MQTKTRNVFGIKILLGGVMHNETTAAVYDLTEKVSLLMEHIMLLEALIKQLDPRLTHTPCAIADGCLVKK